MIGEYPTKAHALYNDVCGTFAGDISDSETLKHFLTAIGFDFNTYYPYSIKFIFTDASIPIKTINLAILAVNKDEVGKTIDDIISYANDHKRNVPTYRFIKQLSIKEFFNKFKRFEIDFAYHSKSLHDYSSTINYDTKKEISLD